MRGICTCSLWNVYSIYSGGRTENRLEAFEKVMSAPSCYCWLHLWQILYYIHSLFIALLWQFVSDFLKRTQRAQLYIHALLGYVHKLWWLVVEMANTPSEFAISHSAVEALGTVSTGKAEFWILIVFVACMWAYWSSYVPVPLTSFIA